MLDHLNGDRVPHLNWHWSCETHCRDDDGDHVVQLKEFSLRISCLLLEIKVLI